MPVVTREAVVGVAPIPTAPSAAVPSPTAQLPSAQLPTEQVLAKLAGEEVRQLQQFLTTPLDYHYQPQFDQPDAEQHYLGVRTRRVTGITDHALVALPAEAEADLFIRYSYVRYRLAKVFTAYAGKRLTLSASRDVLYWGRWTQKLRAEIIQKNVPLVLSMAKRTKMNGLDFNELVSEGNMALIRSAEKFDPRRGFRFSTYACRAILKSFSRVAMKTSRYRTLFPVELNSDLERSDFLDRKRVGTEETCLDELKQILGANVAQLSDIEQTVIRERFALQALPDLNGGKTLEQVGELIGVTKERVRQIQNKALKKIRTALEEQFLAA
ncbi:MAG: RNA polymerase sigma factor RpoS [Phycisphaerae bacterium]|nr:RNA polymerase sigma factor RpoS [Phycisphaerae bacterium]